MSKLWRGLSLALAAVLVATVLVAMPSLTDSNEADAANAADFNPGNIISDENFYNGSAMTSAQISSWLKGANAGCVSGRNCILNYTENTPTMPADAYCGHLEGKKGESAASVIARVGKACDISQKALLVLLEKEQSLISLRDVPNWKWESATGYGCPDTAPCDAGFGGFFTQVYYGARAYQYYAAHPTQYRHQPMATNSVLYNPNSACGSSRVYIQNYATAGLYNYTPYQPNKAAMNNLYGVGDSCSAYGNRNFWRMYTDWFGSPTSKMQTGDVVQSTKTRDYFIYSGSEGMVRVPNRAHLVSLGQHLGVQQMSANDILSFGLSGKRVDSWGIKCGSTNYFASTGKLQGFESKTVENHYRMSFSTLPNDICSTLPKSGTKISQAATDLRGNVWMIESGQKRHSTQKALESFGLGQKTKITLPTDFVNAMAKGKPATVTGAGIGDVVRSSKTGDYFIYSEQSGMIRVESRAHLVSMGLHLGVDTVVPNSILADGLSSVRVNSWGITCGSTNYFSSTGKLQAFESNSAQSAYRMNFNKLPADVCSTLTVSSSKVSIVATDLRDRLWVIDRGQKRPATAASLKAAGLSGKFQITLPTAFVNKLPTGLPLSQAAQIQQTPQSTVDQLESGALVESATSGEQFLYSESDGLVAVEDPAFVEALGIEAEPVALEDFEVQLIGTSDTVLNTWGITCGGESYFAAGGELTLFAPDTLVHYPLGFVELPADICGTLAVSDAEIGKAVTDAAGQVWIIYEGRKHLASDEWLAENPPRTEPFALPAAYLKQVPTGTGLE
ncbi:hypothetical protein [Agrococcus casei]|uniref:hypothetical protein n=1 Tax=Agrococcus casei TaxID=343512 RepID=UPI003F90652A